MQKHLAADLEKFGAIKSSIRWLHEISPKNINYLDLTPTNSNRTIDKDALWPTAVIESNGIAIAYIVNTNNPSKSRSDIAQLNRLRHRLACRGDNAYLVAWEPGNVCLYPLTLSYDMPDSITFLLSQAIPEFNLVIKDTPGSSLLFQDAANAVLKSNPNNKFNDAPQAKQIIFNLLKKVALALNSNPALDDC